jgi:ankyrin repeat protein
MNVPKGFVEAVAEGQFEVAKQFLSSGTDINAGYGEVGWTALHYCAENILPESTKWLIENGADPNRPDLSGWTPLHLAIDSESDAARQHWDVTGTYPPAAIVVAVLLQGGADPNARANDGRTPLGLALSYRNSEAIAVLKQYGAKDIA